MRILSVFALACGFIQSQGYISRVLFKSLVPGNLVQSAGEAMATRSSSRSRSRSASRSKAPARERSKARSSSRGSPREGSAVAPRRMKTRGGVQDTPEGKKDGGNWRKLAVVLAATALLTQSLSFMASGSAQAFKTLQHASLGIVGLQWVVFLHASGLVFGNDPTERFYDLTGAMTWILSTIFVSGAHTSGGWDALNLRQQVLASMVGIWALRLGTFLFTRIQGDGGVDSRFVEIKASPARFLSAWTLQGLWIFITGIAVTSLVALGPSSNAPLSIQDYVGMGLWGVGFLFEVIADWQKRRFKANKKNEFKFISEGLWKLSRHPNYFGEILLWTGIYISANAGMTSNLQKVTTAISPIFIALLLVFVSGIPLLEKASDAKFATSKGYAHFKATTPTLIPFVGRKGDAPF